MISKTPFIVVDCETTGLVPSLDRVIEIGAVKVLDGKVVDEFSTLINPEIFIPTEITGITGITTEMLQGHPFIQDVLPKYMEFLGSDYVFVAHNVEFDKEFINESLLRSQMTKMNSPYLCTINLARHVHPNLARYNLGNLAQLFNVELPQAHRAIHDARATAQLFVKFMKVLQDGGLKYIHEIPHIQNAKKPEKGVEQGQVSLF